MAPEPYPAGFLACPMSWLNSRPAALAVIVAGSEGMCSSGPTFPSGMRELEAVAHALSYSGVEVASWTDTCSRVVRGAKTAQRGPCTCGLDTLSGWAASAGERPA